MTDAEFRALAERAAERYRSSGKYAWHFARGKLRGDPFFRYAVGQIPLLEPRSVLDLGCGQGLLFACLAEAPERPKANTIVFHGIELQGRRVDIARRALGDIAVIGCGDIRTAEFPRSDLIVVVDVLLYLTAAEQDRVLERCVRALEPGGTLLLREADASAGLRFRITEWAERALCAARGEPGQKLHYRGKREWCTALGGLGLAVTMQPMSEGTPFSNVLYVATKA